jgi:hypothetical protein
VDQRVDRDGEPEPGRTLDRVDDAERELRGKDSNLDYLIQSQASYH